MFPNGSKEGYAAECKQPVTFQTLHCPLNTTCWSLKDIEPEMAKTAKANEC